MVRIFNHYLRRRTVMQIGFDVGLIVAVLLLVAVGQGVATLQALPVAASHGLSLAGFIFLINSATGFYQPAAKRSLTETCARALVALLRRQGGVASRLELLHEVWGHSAAVLTRTVDTHVAELRRKLEEHAAAPRHILTVRKAGYRLDRQGVRESSAVVE